MKYNISISKICLYALIIIVCIGSCSKESKNSKEDFSEDPIVHEEQRKGNPFEYESLPKVKVASPFSIGNTDTRKCLPQKLSEDDLRSMKEFGDIIWKKFFSSSDSTENTSISKSFTVITDVVVGDEADVIEEGYNVQHPWVQQLPNWGYKIYKPEYYTVVRLYNHKVTGSLTLEVFLFHLKGHFANSGRLYLRLASASNGVLFGEGNGEYVEFQKDDEWVAFRVDLNEKVNASDEDIENGWDGKLDAIQKIYPLNYGAMTVCPFIESSDGNDYYT